MLLSFKLKVWLIVLGVKDLLDRIFYGNCSCAVARFSFFFYCKEENTFLAFESQVPVFLVVYPGTRLRLCSDRAIVFVFMEQSEKEKNFIFCWVHTKYVR